MRRTLGFLAAAAVISVANPYINEIVTSEFETAPQWFERLELQALFYTRPLPFDISGAVVITNAGTAVVDSGVRFDTWPHAFVVLDSTNTTGTFSLGNDSDHIRVYIPDGSDTFELEVRYPASPFGAGSWAPPIGASASLSWSRVWYIDVSPTFGTFNDDGGGGIAGRVYDQDSGLDGATVHIKSVYGCGTAALRTYRDTLNRHGCFALKPTGPGRFVVTVECSGYLPYTYPESIELAVNEGRQLSIYLDRAGVAEERVASANVAGLHQRGRAVVLNSDRPGSAVLFVYDNSGRIRLSERVALQSGSNELALPSLRSGVYFALVQGKFSRDIAKVVLW